MSDARDQGAERETEVLPAVGSGADIVRTKELPVIEDETVVAPPPVADRTAVTPPPAPVPVPAPLPTPVPAPAAQALGVYPPPAAVDRPAPAPAPVGKGRGTAWRNAFLALVVVLVVAAVAGGVVVARGRLGTSAPARGGSSAAVAAPATITSFDPSGGSGFRKESGSTWRTQTYQSAAFGNLKDGVGLLLDLGSARQVAAVTFEAVGGPIAVELRAGDERAASAGGYQTVANDGSASGPTTLTPKNAGKHRYWLVWVTRLASQDGGFRAVLANPAVTASPS